MYIPPTLFHRRNKGIMLPSLAWPSPTHICHPTCAQLGHSQMSCGPTPHTQPLTPLTYANNQWPDDSEPLTVWEELKCPITQQHYYFSNVSQSAQWEPPRWVDYIDPDSVGFRWQ